MAQLPELMPHQILARDHILNVPKCAVWLDVGGSKTLSTLVALQDARPAGHILVIAPKAIARSTWFQEIEKWGINIRTKSLIDNENDVPLSRKKRLEGYQQIAHDPPTMYFINVDLVDDLINELPTYRGVPQWPFPTVVIDESQEFKSPKSVRFKALSRVNHAITRMIQLSGTPTPKDLMDLWSQIYLLDNGQALSDNFEQFRATYFFPTKFKNGKPIVWEMHPWAEDTIHQRIKHLALSTENISIPKPKASFHDIEIPLPKKVAAQYHEFKKELILELASIDPNNPEDIVILGKNNAIMHNKLLQFSSGTLYTGENHDTDYVVMHSEKLEMADYIIRNNNKSPVIIAYRYRSDQHELMKYLKKKGHHVELFDGSRKMQDRWNAGEIEVMLLQPASYRHGINIQDGGSTLIWYSLPDSYEYYHQTNGRIDRMGQTNPVNIYKLLAQGTRDMDMPKMLGKKQSIQENLLDSVRQDALDILPFGHGEDMEELIGDLDISPL